MLRTMTILIDTREQQTSMLLRRVRQMEELGHKVERQKLLAGDYSASLLIDGERVTLKTAIERKMSSDELAHCFGRDRARFAREFQRAADNGIKLYLLVEGTSWEDLFAGKYYSKMKPAAMIASLISWMARYGVVPVFCEPFTSGKLIEAILLREARHYLETRCLEESNGCKEQV